ncbi:MAG: hypothetical protein ACO4BJ_13605, partial [Planctomycetota bacterium]
MAAVARARRAGATRLAGGTGGARLALALRAAGPTAAATLLVRPLPDPIVPGSAAAPAPLMALRLPRLAVGDLLLAGATQLAALHRLLPQGRAAGPLGAAVLPLEDARALE